MAYGCLVKTYAFISALLSVAVLGFSLVVLISSVTHSSINGENGINNPQDNHSTTLSTNYIEEDNNRTVVNSLHVPFYVPSMTTPPPNTITNTSFRLLKEKGESRNVSTPLPASVSPVLFTLSNTSHTTTSPFYRYDDDNSNNSSVESSESTNATTTNLDHWNAFLEHQHDFWETKSDTYIILIQASSGTGIFAALLQLGFAWLLICGSTKDLKDRTTLWNLSNFIVLILVVVIILVPLSYNSTSDTFKGSGVFWREIYRMIKSVEFSSKTLETIWNSFPNFLATDLVLYYYVLGVDAFILLALLIPPLVRCLCYPCKKCCWKGKRGKSESDLMLFGTGGGGGASVEAY